MATQDTPAKPATEQATAPKASDAQLLARRGLGAGAPEQAASKPVTSKMIKK